MTGPAAPVQASMPQLEIALDTPDDDAAHPFWEAMLDVESAPPLWFQQTDSTAPTVSASTSM